MIKAGIIGGGGYTAGELIRILLNHPDVDIDFVFSNSQQGKMVSDIHDDLVGECDLPFTGEVNFRCDVLFLCTGHGQSKAFLEKYPVPDDLLLIDLSQDYRLDENFVYGLPELNRERIRQSRRIANCGCFATAIQLGLLPLASAGLLQDEIHIHAITGSTGAGQSPKPTTHFSWRNNNLSVYKAFQHQHLAEIKQSLQQLQPGFEQPLNFIPVRGDFTRGIFASLYLNSEISGEEAQNLFRSYYREEPFTKVTTTNPSLKQVVNTNKCLVHLEKHNGKLLIISAIDNLLKGASGQAVQNMNIALGLQETTGLKLKALAF